MLSIIAWVGSKCRKLRLNSHASATKHSCPPTSVLPPSAGSSPPMCTVGLVFSSQSDCASIAEVVVLPWVPHTFTARL